VNEPLRLLLGDARAVQCPANLHAPLNASEAQPPRGRLQRSSTENQAIEGQAARAFRKHGQWIDFDFANLALEVGD
jgi:hypothetical protein